MPRYKLLIEYNGAGFVGWQRQKDGLGVQAALEEAGLAFSGEKIQVFGAGRTDAGVHARGQVAHLDMEKKWDCFKVQEAMNFHLRPLLVSVLKVDMVDEDFDARFSAVERTYLYKIVNRRASLTFDKGFSWRVPVGLNDHAMNDAAQVLIGQHDFTSFRASECQAKSPVKTLDELRVERLGENIHIHVRARSFLHHQVRNFVGSLRLVGEGKWTKQDMKATLEARDRRAAGPTAPAEGLYLMKVEY